MYVLVCAIHYSWQIFLSSCALQEKIKHLFTQTFHSPHALDVDYLNALYSGEKWKRNTWIAASLQTIFCLFMSIVSMHLFTTIRSSYFQLNYWKSFYKFEKATAVKLTWIKWNCQTCVWFYIWMAGWVLPANVDLIMVVNVLIDFAPFWLFKCSCKCFSCLNFN